MFKNRSDKAHLVVSLFKSGLRIITGICLINRDFLGAGIWHIAAETLGIIEELVV